MKGDKVKKTNEYTSDSTIEEEGLDDLYNTEPKKRQYTFEEIMKEMETRKRKRTQSICNWDRCRNNKTLRKRFF